MIEVIQAPEIAVLNTVNAVKLTYVIDGVSTTVYLVECGVKNGESYYQYYNEEEVFNIFFNTENWSFYVNSIIFTSPTINTYWEDEGYISITTNLTTIQNECLKLTFDSTIIELQKIGILNTKNLYYFQNELLTYAIVFDSIWTLSLPESGYTIPTTPEIPISDAWEYQSGTEYTTVVTESCSFTSKWQAVHHPIKWQLQRKDAIVISTSMATILGEKFKLELSDIIPIGVVEGASVDFFDSFGVKRSGIILDITGNFIIVSFPYIFGVIVEYCIFPNLYSNYFIETAIMHNGTDEIGTLRTIPNSDGSVLIDVHRFLKTQAKFENTETEIGISGKYKLKFRECYNFTQQAYSELTAFYYWSNSAKQIRDIYGSNMAEYVGNLEQPCKFLSVFERPTHFLGFPFSLSYITSGDWTKLLRKVENGSAYTLIDHVSGAVNRLQVSDTATYVLIQYGTLTLLPAVFTYEGNLTESKVIKINTQCLINAVCLSWLNTLGGREYWVFRHNQIHSVDTSVGGTFEPYIQDLATERSNIFDLERFETNKITLGATVDIEDIKGLKTVLSSICVEMETAQGWVNVRPETGSFKVYESKGTTADIEFTIQLPYTNIQSR